MKSTFAGGLFESDNYMLAQGVTSMKRLDLRFANNTIVFNEA